MQTDRRRFLSGAASGLIAAPLSGTVSAALGVTSIRRIATEEAFVTPELVKAWLEIARSQPESSLDISTGILSIFDNLCPGSNQDRFRRQLLDVDVERLGEMDQASVDMQVLSVTIPGVQMFEPGATLSHSSRVQASAQLSVPASFTAMQNACFGLLRSIREVAYGPFGIATKRCDKTCGEP